jgi:hypothetical protein
MHKNQESNASCLDSDPVGRIERSIQPHVPTTLMRLLPLPVIAGDGAI